MLDYENENGSNLERFLKAQEKDYQRALKEIQNGRKETCWFWYIFPQIDGLGMSYNTKYYAIKDIQEATDYFNNPILRKNLLDICNALLMLNTNDITEVLNYPDDLKLKSSMTLFSLVSSECEVFDNVLKKFFNGERDELTLKILKDNSIQND